MTRIATSDDLAGRRVQSREQEARRRGGVFGSIFGAVLVQTTSNGLVMLNANPYLYPLVNSLIIFIAAWVDGRRRLMTERLEQRKIRVEA